MHTTLADESPQILRRGAAPSVRAALPSGPSTEQVTPITVPLTRRCFSSWFCFCRRFVWLDIHTVQKLKREYNESTPPSPCLSPYLVSLPEASTVESFLWLLPEKAPRQAGSREVAFSAACPSLVRLSWHLFLSVLVGCFRIVWVSPT